MIQSDRTLIFAGEDENSAVKLLQTLRSRDIGGALRSAYVFEGAEPAARVIIMEDVPEFVAAPIKAAFPGICQHREFAPAETGGNPFEKFGGTPIADPFATVVGDLPKRRGRPPKVKTDHLT